MRYLIMLFMLLFFVPSVLAFETGPDPDDPPSDDPPVVVPSMPSGVSEYGEFVYSENGLSFIRDKYTTRFNEFLGQMQATPLFSMPQRLVAAEFSGDSTVTLNLGRLGGTVEFDFSDIFSGFVAVLFRGLVLVSVMLVSIRIVMLGKTS